MIREELELSYFSSTTNAKARTGLHMYSYRVNFTGQSRKARKEFSDGFQSTILHLMRCGKTTSTGIDTRSRAGISVEISISEEISKSYLITGSNFSSPLDY